MVIGATNRYPRPCTVLIICCCAPVSMSNEVDEEFQGLRFNWDNRSRFTQLIRLFVEFEIAKGVIHRQFLTRKDTPSRREMYPGRLRAVNRKRLSIKT